MVLHLFSVHTAYFRLFHYFQDTNSGKKLKVAHHRTKEKKIDYPLLSVGASYDYALNFQSNFTFRSMPGCGLGEKFLLLLQG